MPFFFCLVLTTMLAYSQSKVEGLERYIQPEIGLDNGGHVLPGPSLPYGMVKLGPDCVVHTNSGYVTGEKIKGFSHTHVSGTGGGAKYGDVTIAAGIDAGLIKPVVGDEKITAGYYKVNLEK